MNRPAAEKAKGKVLRNTVYSRQLITCSVPVPTEFGARLTRLKYCPRRHNKSYPGLLPEGVVAGGQCEGWGFLSTRSCLQAAVQRANRLHIRCVLVHASALSQG